MPFLVRWPAGIKPGTQSDAMALNVDFAPTFLDAAGIPVPADMQGRSLLPVLRGRTPADWRTSMYYRYYHDPGDHNTRAHYGVRTTTHKLIYFWKKDQWELFDLVNDPVRAAQPVRRARPGAADRDAQGRARATEEARRRRRPARQRADAERRRWTGGEAARKVASGIHETRSRQHLALFALHVRLLAGRPSAPREPQQPALAVDACGQAE